MSPAGALDMSNVRFIERSEAFAVSPAIAAWVVGFQRALFVLDEHLVAEGEAVWLEPDAEEPCVLTARQAERMNAETREEFARLLDPFPETPDRAVDGREIVAEPDCRSMRGIGGAMKRHMNLLADELGADELIVLPAVRQSILCQSNDYPPVARATAVLEAAGLAQSERMATIGPVDVVAEWLGPLFWIARCNAGAPDIVVGAPGVPLAGVLCKHGNVHFTAIEKRREMIGALKRSGFRLPPNGACRERFARRSAIAGRRLDL